VLVVFFGERALRSAAKKVSSTQHFPPAAQALLQSCVQSALEGSDAEKLALVLPRVAPPDVALPLRAGLDRSYAQITAFVIGFDMWEGSCE